MRCLSCNCQLNDHEATRKYAHSRQFIDLCDRCFGHVEDEIDAIDGNPPTNDDSSGGHDPDYV